MQALITTPGEPHSLRLEQISDASTEAGIQIRTLEVGVCGTDREIAEGEFGIAPDGERDLILGHEFLGEVMEDGSGFSRGDLVTATVRRSCGLCPACAQGAPDECHTGRYTERGITRLNGFARGVVIEDPAQLVLVPKALGRFGVLAEPTSVCARAVRHTFEIGGRQVWSPQRALVIGCGAIGMLTTYLLRLRGLEVWTAAVEAEDTARAELVTASGSTYVSTELTTVQSLRSDVGGFDIVIEAAGDAQMMLDVIGLLSRNGVGCLLGLDSRHQQLSIDGPVIGIDSVLENRVLFGSVNARIDDSRTAVDELVAIRRRWPETLEGMIGLRVTPDRFADAFAFNGVKATLVFD